MAVITRTQKKNQEKERAIVADKEHQSGAIHHAIHIRELSKCIELKLDDEVPGSQRVRQSLICQEANNVKITFTLYKQQQQHPLEMTAEELVQLQEDHSSLEAVHWAVKGEDSTTVCLSNEME